MSVSASLSLCSTNSISHTQTHYKQTLSSTPPRQDHGRAIEDHDELKAAAQAFARHYAATRGGAAAPQLAAAPHGAAAKGAAAASVSDTDGADAVLGIAGSDADGKGGGAAAAKSSSLGSDAAAGAAAASALAAANGAASSGAAANGANGRFAWLARARSSGGGIAADAISARASWGLQFRTLLWRELLAMMRNPLDVAGRMLCFALLATFTGLIFWNLDESIDGTRTKVCVGCLCCGC